jgi:hypothetical protein
VSQDESPHSRTRWQFTLRDLLIGIAIFAAVLGIAKWLGPLGAAGALAGVAVSLLGWAVYSRRKGLAVWSGICLAVCLVDLGLFWFGPRSHVVSVCTVCGEKRDIATFLGIKWHEVNQETELSKWYREAELRTHSHTWTVYWSFEQHWGGDQSYSGSFGWQLYPLKLLRQSRNVLDRKICSELERDFADIGDDEGKIKAFCKKCHKMGVDVDL